MQKGVDKEKVAKSFPYGNVEVKVVGGGLRWHSGVIVPKLGKFSLNLAAFLGLCGLDTYCVWCVWVLKKRKGSVLVLGVELLPTLSMDMSAHFVKVCGRGCRHGILDICMHC